MGKGPEQILFHRGQTEGSYAYEKCSMSLAIRELQIKPHYITSHLPEWLSLINQQGTNAGKAVEKKEP